MHRALRRPPVLGVTSLAALCLLCAATARIGLAQAPARTGGEAVQAVVEAAKAQTMYTRYYDPSYRTIDYPGGDVPRDRGVCTDVIVRAFRAAAVDLQRLVHEDMSAAFQAYPQRWGLSRPDRNIDHRRVPNLMTFFERSRAARPLPLAADAVRPGDVVAWNLGGGTLHMGLATAERASGRLLFVHNIGSGAALEDILRAWPVIGHYRYFPSTGAP
jgi:uncharacterized protein YijF (DUF1287 family)